MPRQEPLDSWSISNLNALRLIVEEFPLPTIKFQEVEVLESAKVEKEMLFGIAITKSRDKILINPKQLYNYFKEYRSGKFSEKFKSKYRHGR